MLDTSAVTIFDEDEDEDVEDIQETTGKSILLSQEFILTIFSRL